MRLSLETYKKELQEELPAGLFTGRRRIDEEQTAPLQRSPKAAPIRAAKAPDDLTELEHLTPRELQVLQLICDGYTSRQIAERLGISFKTALTHRAHIMEKFNVHNTVDLVRYAITKGIIQL